MLSIPSNLQDLWMSEGELVDMLHVTAMKLHAVIRLSLIHIYEQLDDVFTNVRIEDIGVKYSDNEGEMCIRDSSLISPQ